MSDEPLSQAEIILHQTADGGTRVPVRLPDETVWLAQQPVTELLQTSRQNGSLPIQNLFAEGARCEDSIVEGFTLLPGYPRIKRVKSFQELVATPFGDGINALCWPRTLAGDFGEVVEHLGAGEGIPTPDEARLASLPVSAAGRVAIEILLEDARRLREHDRDPVLNCIHGYPRDEDAGPVRTDVFSFHADSAPVEADTWLCTYHGPASEGLRNDEARRRVDLPETRAELLQLFGGEDDDDFLAYLNEHHYDLHSAPIPQARPFSFGLGNLWRVAVDWPGSAVPPCIHRAPGTLPGEPPRLLLIS